MAPLQARIFFALFATLTTVGGIAPAQESSAPPNILLILADDLGYGDVACYNPESKVPTPNLDQLAADGMRFTDAHSPSTVCTPTRYSLLTGRMAFRTGFRSVFAGIGGPALIEEGRLTLPQMLQDQGYATACIGKWHIGMSFFDGDGKLIKNRGLEGVQQADFSHRIPDGPVDRGFDHFFGTVSCPTTDWFYAWVVDDRVPNPPTKLLDKSTLPKHVYSRDCRRGMIADDFDLETVDLTFLEKSQAWLRQHVKQKPEQPFFLFHSMQAVHLPSFPAKQFQGRTNAGPHGDFIFEMDWIVGELLNTLEQLNVADNTLVIFCSDNGPEVLTAIDMRNTHNHDGARPWRGVKRDQWEGGHRTPMIVRWPGKVLPGSISDELLSLTDIMATCAAIVGATIPANAAEDSFDMLPVLLGEFRENAVRPHLLQQTISLAMSIRVGDWKYLDHKGSGGNNYQRDGDWGMKQFALADTDPDAPGQLYHLTADPGERNNLHSKHPERAATMKARLDELKASGRSAPLPLPAQPAATSFDLPTNGSQSRGPVVPGLHAKHSLKVVDVGSVLIGEMGCVKCHDDIRGLSSHHKDAPDLSRVGERVTPEFLRKFISQPSALVPGTTMPHMMNHIPMEHRDQAAEALTQFLLSRTTEPLKREAIDSVASSKGQKLYHSVGCVACHDPFAAVTEGGTVPGARPGSVGLDHLPEKYTVPSLAEFLYDPLAVRPSGRMPDMSLSRVEAHAIASYLLDRETIAFAPPPADFPLAEEGRSWYRKLNCVSCHPLDGVEARNPVPMRNPLNSTDGCLSNQTGRAPDFQFSDLQRNAIRTAIADGVHKPAPKDQLAITLTTFNCISCHDRDDYGGISPELDLYFGTDEPSLGNEVRHPATLTGAGAKLNPDWMHRVLFNRARVRPYMHTRMPQHGEANLGNLPALFAEVDPAPPIEIPVFRGKQRGEMHDAARQLVGSGMLGCISCHAFNGKPSPAMNGLDLTTTAERLQPAWLESFLINPQAHRPGIVMPPSWPGGVALRKDVLDGDTKKQIAAIWSYLEQGRTARDPKGIRHEPTLLTVDDEPRTYRGRSRIAGFRGIAVGFPGGLNYAFNAETGALSGIWKGGFVRVRWDSQGAGDFDPQARAVELPKDLGLARLAGVDDPWPLLPVMTEEEPVNPDPLYPRRLGYRFGGYSLDQERVPTLFYRLGEIKVADRTHADDKGLLRELAFTSGKAETIYLRLAAGEVKSISPRQFQLGKLILHLPNGKPILRPSSNDGEQELLLQLELPQGQTSIELRYELQ